MTKNYRKGLARKYYVFLVNLKMEIENNPYISVNYLLREHHIDIRLNSVLYDLEIITRGRKTEWLALEPTIEMAQKCMTGVRAKRYTEKINRISIIIQLILSIKSQILMRYE